MNEDDITFSIKEFLIEKSWEIISYNPPGGHGGTIIDIKNLNDFNSKKWQIPDIVAYKNNMVILVECKPKFDDEDAQKLNNLFENEKIIKKLEELIIFQLLKTHPDINKNKLSFFKALGYSGEVIIPKDFIIFHVNENEDINVLNGLDIMINTLF